MKTHFFPARSVTQNAKDLERPVAISRNAILQPVKDLSV